MLSNWFWCTWMMVSLILKCDRMWHILPALLISGQWPTYWAQSGMDLPVSLWTSCGWDLGLANGIFWVCRRPWICMSNSNIPPTCLVSDNHWIPNYLVKSLKWIHFWHLNNALFFKARVCLGQAWIVPWDDILSYLSWSINRNGSGEFTFLTDCGRSPRAWITNPIKCSMAYAEKVQMPCLKWSSV